MTPFKPASLLFASTAVFCTSSLLAGCGGSNTVPVDGGGSPAQTVTGPAYVLTDISNGKYDGATAINNAGQALVTSEGSSSVVLLNAFYNASRVVRKRDFRQAVAPAYSYLYDGARFVDVQIRYPVAFNDKQQIVGDYGFGSLNAYQDGSFVAIPPLGIPAAESAFLTQPSAINNAGQVVGTSALGPAPTGYNAPNYHAFLYENGHTTDLGTLGEPTPINFPPDTSIDPASPFNHSNSAALGINDAGQVVGVSGTSARGRGVSTVQHAFLYSSGKMMDLGTLGGVESFATSVNNQGQAVGYAQLGGTDVSHAALWQNGQVQDLGAPQGYNSFALGINDAAQVVGTTAPPSDTLARAGRAFVYRDGKMLDLNKQVTNISGWTLNAATGINSKGQIVGYGDYKGSTRAFLLTPK